MNWKEFVEAQKAYPNEPNTAEVIIGNFHIMLKHTCFTKRQIKHIKKYFGFDIRNLEDK